ncbi:hypothetical protein CROQUDRAFT_655978 [Cronartium quercuum f. sp. fusiforme G11]|uniref:Uncharacterized protein n=1 Tax=Cronartium quercuum f. sp. fusiforme G11 TaxID=708437 RepID=A0A9P6TEB9_9BASI|nr:hypothetical protein CROQUDRAFT_655978 [Cronartium quercuum f. sp. fusiforme G11]
MDPRARLYPDRRGVAVEAQNPLSERWALEERILGLYPAIPNDLIASMLFSIVFLALLGGCYFVWRLRPYRSLSIYILAVACLVTFLGFAVRAGISNTLVPTRASFMVECMLFIIGQLCTLDAWAMRTRDELVNGLAEREGVDLQAQPTPRSWLLAAKHSWESRIALFSRLLILPLSFLLYLIGYAMTPGPADEHFDGSEGLKVRGAASFLPLVILAIMSLVLVMKACLYTQAWLPVLLYFFASIMLWLPALYAFCLVSIAVDTSSLVISKTFFYTAFGFAQAVCIIILLFLTRRPANWVYDQPTEGDPPPPPGRYAFVPPKWVQHRVCEPGLGGENI